MQQIAQGTVASHDVYVYADGVLTDLDALPTYSIDDADGNSIATGTATNPGVGIYRVQIPQASQVARYTVTWTGTLSSNAWTQDTEVEVVGEHLFTIAELRAYHGGDLTSTSTYPIADLAAIRSAITDEFESICGVSFVPRYRREVLPGSGTMEIEVSGRRIGAIIAAEIGGVSVSASSFTPSTERGHRIRRTDGYFDIPSSSDPRNVTISYRHGYEVIPPEIRNAAIAAARYRALRQIQGSGVPSHASAWSDSTGTYQAFGANDQTGRWYGLPEVDVALRRFRVAPVWG